MAPSPRKQPPGTPKKVAQGTPTKATRTSPRKKAWASPAKAIAKFKSEIFTEEEFTELSNKSWAEITEEDEELNLSNRLDAERRCKSESRRKGQPKRANQKSSKFVRNLELTDEVFKTTSLRRSERSKSRTRNGTGITVVEKETISEMITLETSSGPISRKRCLSNASTIHEEMSPTKRRVETGKTNRKVSRAIFSSSDNCSVASSPSRKDHWEEPTLGWCTDDAVLKRRSREIERAKEKAVYQRYVSEVALRDRIKGVHPRTPNKLINYSRRSWDTQIKKWKRSLYEYCGEEPSDSVNTSFCSNSDDAMSVTSEQNDEKESENKSVLKDLVIPVRGDVDCMASLLGKFDVDSQMGLDESTLKASSNVDPSAPTDFSKLCSKN